MVYIHIYEHIFEGLPTLSPDTNNPICESVYGVTNYVLLLII